jgi:hypothetical protein
MVKAYPTCTLLLHSHSLDMNNLDLSMLDEQNKYLVVVFMFKYYMPDLDLWSINYIVYENTFAGYFITTPIRSFVFQPNIQETGKERSLVMCDSFVFVLSVLLIAISILEIYLKSNFTLMKAFKFSYILSYIIFTTSLFTVIGIGYLKKDTAKLLKEDNSSANFISMYDWYQAITYAQCLQFACILFFILRWISLFKSTHNLLFILRKVRLSNN